MQARDRKSVFREAVLDLAEDPTLRNARRYLRASARLGEAIAGVERSLRLNGEASYRLEARPDDRIGPHGGVRAA
jgi:hypothetical protein